MNHHYLRLQPLVLGIILLAGCLLPAAAFSQGYTSFFTGDTTDAVATASGGVCMMGGATEDDNAMRWFLTRSGGGDILVLRASGSDGYNAYLYSQLGVTVNSVETIRFDIGSAASSSYVQRRIAEAEAIWFAGGDQWDYVQYWRGTAIDSLINAGLSDRNIVIGGTSAGMAILGEYYFSAMNGSVTSAAAMANPYAVEVTPDGTQFLDVDYLDNVITDTHYDDPDRRGRHVTFLARILTDASAPIKGIACDEYTAVCIDTNGIAHVYGDAPTSDDNAYFLQVNCEVPDNLPEVCVANQPLQWDQGGSAVKVFTAKGTPSGANTFDLRDWKTGVGGTWEHWSVYNSILFTAAATEISCGPTAVVMGSDGADALQIFPNPSADGQVQIALQETDGAELTLRNGLGQVVWRSTACQGQSQVAADFGALPRGVYWLQASGSHGTAFKALILQ